jgi:hypothetical protein
MEANAALSPQSSSSSAHLKAIADSVGDLIQQWEKTIHLASL